MIPEPLRVVRDDLLGRLVLVQERIDAYHPHCQRRHAMNAVADVRRSIAGADRSCLQSGRRMAPIPMQSTRSESG